MVSLVAPLNLTSIACCVDLSPIRGTFPQWASIANWLLLLVAVYMLGGPFVIRLMPHRRESFDARAGQSAKQIVFLMGTGGALAVVSIAFVVTIFAGGPLSYMYGWATLSFAVAVYWSWRYRNLLR